MTQRHAAGRTAIAASRSVGIAQRAFAKVVVRPAGRWWTRQQVMRVLEHVGELGAGVCINGSFELGNPAGTSLGDDVCVNAGFVQIGSGALRIGSHVHFGQQVRVLTDNHNFESPACLPYDHVRLTGDVMIGDCVWIGDRVSIMPGVTVGDGAVVGAGSVVTRDVDALAVVGGAPATTIRHRDAEAYARLREQGRFLNWPRDHDLVLGRRVLLVHPDRT